MGDQMRVAADEAAILVQRLQHQVTFQWTFILKLEKRIAAQRRRIARLQQLQVRKKPLAVKDVTPEHDKGEDSECGCQGDCGTSMTLAELMQTPSVLERPEVE